MKEKTIEKSFDEYMKKNYTENYQSNYKREVIDNQRCDFANGVENKKKKKERNSGIRQAYISEDEIVWRICRREKPIEKRLQNLCQRGRGRKLGICGRLITKQTLEKNMEVNEIMEAVRRMRTYQKKAGGKRNDYQFQDDRRQAEKEVDRLIKEWEDKEFHKRQTQLF